MAGHRIVVRMLLTLVLTAGAQIATAQSKVIVDTTIAPQIQRGSIGIAHAADGTMYVLDRHDKRIWVFDSYGKHTGHISGFGHGPSDLSSPRDLAADLAGNAIVADAGDVVKVFSKEGTLIASFGFRRPQSVGVLSDGSILVSGFPTVSLISVYTPQGALVGSWVLSCAAFDSETDTLWVAAGNQLFGLDANGRITTRLELLRNERGEWLQPYSMTFFGAKARFASIQQGVFEVDKNRLSSAQSSAQHRIVPEF